MTTYPKITSGADLIAVERQRQVEIEGYGPQHDQHHDDQSLAKAAAGYIQNGWGDADGDLPFDWPWRREDWKPSPDDRVRELVKAGALIAAEIDRLQVSMSGQDFAAR